MFEIIGRWLIVFAFGYVVGKLYRIPAIFHFVERDSGRGTRVEYRSIYAKRNPKPCFKWRVALLFFIVPFGIIVIFWALSCGKIVGEIYDLWASLSSHKWLADMGAVCWFVAHIIAHWICYLIGLLVSMSHFKKIDCVQNRQDADIKT